MNGGKVSRRGVFYDLELSPYEYTSPYGDIFKFSSAKKLEIYARDVDKEIKRFDAFLDRHDLREILPIEIIDLVKRKQFRAFYKTIER